MDEAKIITTRPELARLAEQLLRAEAVALDTEFFWERTYYPILGLVQIATGEDACWLIDTVCLPDLKELAPVLESGSITKILHDAGQDLWILSRATGATPRQIFDTRLAAGFAGLSSVGSLQSLLQTVLNVELAKAETRSNWLRRPLRDEQLRYAVDDVRHLPRLRLNLIARCVSDQVRSWLQEEQALFNNPAIYEERDPRQMYLRVKGYAGLNTRQLAVLRELAEWREQEAKKRDWPRGHVLTDAVLITLANRIPADRQELMRIIGVARGLPAMTADTILAALARAVNLPADACPEPALAPGREMRQKLKTKSDCLLVHVRETCAAWGIDPDLVITRAGAESYVRMLTQGTAADHPLNQSWRREFVAGFILD